MKLEIKAIGVNRADVFYRQGKYPAFGLEVAGIAEDGRRIMAIVNGGAYAREIKVEDGNWLEMPAHFSFIEGAAVVEALYTGYYNLFRLCGLKAGENVLIHGGASGIGVVAIQLARLANAQVAATAGKAEKLELIKSLGAESIGYRARDFGRDKYDVILDMVGADYFNANLAALKTGGRLAVISFIGGVKAELNLAPLLLKNLSVYGSTIRSLTNLAKAEIRDGFMPYVNDIMAVIAKTFAFDEINAALDYVESYKNIGKVVVTV